MLRANTAEFGITPLPDGRPGPGHRPRHRPRAGPDPAGHDHRLRRQPHLHPRRLRRAGLRHRHQRGRARARHPDAAPGAGPAPWPSPSTATCPPASRPRTSILAIIGRIGTGGGIGSVIEYRGSAIRAPLDGGPDDRLQHVDRGRRQGRPDRPGRHHLRLPRGPRLRPDGRRLGGGARRLAHAAPPTTAPPSTRRCASTPPPSSPHVSWGTNPGQVVAARRPRSRPRRLRRRQRARRRRAGPRVHGPHRRHADARGRRRHRLHRLLHQRPHRGPAGRRRGGRGPHGRRTACAPWSCPARSR